MEILISKKKSTLYCIAFPIFTDDRSNTATSDTMTDTSKKEKLPNNLMHLMFRISFFNFYLPLIFVFKVTIQTYYNAGHKMSPISIKSLFSVYVHRRLQVFTSQFRP